MTEESRPNMPGRDSKKKKARPPASSDGPASNRKLGGTDLGIKFQKTKGTPGGGQRPPNYRNVSTSRNGVQGSPAPSESSDALSSLQRVIADLKTTSPSGQSPPIAVNNSLAASMHAPHQLGPNSSVNPTVFQTSSAIFGPAAEAALHRRAVSLGASALPANYTSFSPHLGPMLEDVEDGTGTPVEEGEISEGFLSNSGHQVRGQPQGFMAPRFAALAAQQEQDVLGPTGRPQLAPNFMFGTRRKASSAAPLGPPISEEDVGFQFPQQQHNFTSENTLHEQSHRKPENNMSGIMAEQVRDLVAVASWLSSFMNRSLFKIRLKPFNNNSRHCINSSLPLTRSLRCRMQA